MSRGRLAALIAANVLVLASGAAAQTPGADPTVAVPFGQTPVEDQRIFAHGLLDQFEARVGGSDSFRWDGQA